MPRGVTAHRSIAAFLLAAAAAATLVACGGDGGGKGGPVALQWFIFNEPSGAPQKIAQRCSEQSDGAYTIEFNFLPSDADGQREQLVRRLAAEDDSIDLIGMDVIWTGEFANAGWIAPVPQETAQQVTDNVFSSMVEAASFEGQLYAVPIWTNTQLLWYRTDRVDQPPETWDEMIAMAEEIGPKGTIQVQGNRYEGLTVWTNAMIESAGTSILASPEEIALEQRPTEIALGTMGAVSRSPAAANDLTTSDEDSARLGFESGDSSFMVNYPFVFPSAQENAPEVAENMGAAKYPRVVPDLESAPPLGGINIGVSAFSDHQDVAFEAIECLVQAENQITVAELGGLPPVREDLYDEAAIQEIYPGFAALIRESIQDAAPRPAQSAAYQDLSLAIQRAVHPTNEINPQNPTPTYERLRDLVERAINREGLL